jgi:hypothetical protein
LFFGAIVDSPRMKFLVGLVVVALFACTSSNPHSCTDGTCTDPGLPFCDSDGAISGNAGTCVSVNCSPGTVDSCRGDVAVVCNTQGTSYDLVTCPQNCDVAMGGCIGCTNNSDCPIASASVCEVSSHACVGCLMSSDCTGSAASVCDTSAKMCVGCLMSSDCTGAAKVCDTGPNTCVGCLTSNDCTVATAPYCEAASHSCRGCKANSECASDLCEIATGSCVAATAIIYASPTGGSAVGCGTQAMPCSLQTAFTHLDANHHIVKLAVGNYTASNLTLASGIAEVYGEGAMLTVSSGSAFKVSGSSTLTVYGLRIVHSVLDSSEFVLDVMGNGPTSTFVTLNGVSIDTNNYLFIRSHSLTLERCSLKLSRMNALGDQIYVALQTNGLLTARRTKFDQLTLSIANSQIHVFNSVFVASSLSLLNTVGGMNDVSFSTFIDSPQNIMTPFPIFTMNNNLHFGAGSGGTSVMLGNGFVNHYALMNPQASAPANSDHILLNLDPQFVNVTGGDYHPRSGSPVIDAADPGATIADDFDGTARPVGGARDLGAFEYKP